MEMNECKIGQKVMIKRNIERTHRKFDSCEGMKDMMGKVFKIDSFSPSREYVVVRGYNWDPGDLLLYESVAPEPKIVHFDESNL